MIQPLLWRLDTIPVKTKSVFRIGIRHLIVAVVSPELPALPRILDWRHALTLELLRHFVNIIPDAEDVLPGTQRKLFFGGSAVENRLE